VSMEIEIKRHLVEMDVDLTNFRAKF
jgi:hypothetical protein